ncbi:hypothetical protein GGF46_000093 [Coemansia sp. RSA 552]|nr:hypothetical protein GGF46_000093 [Coemansia sp. RSA 552]
MNSQFSGYDASSTAAANAAATNDAAGGPIHTITAAFANAPDDYDGYDNARARKRRLTVSDARRLDDAAEAQFADAGNNGLFGMFDHHAAGGYAASSQSQPSIGPLMAGGGPGLSSLPIPPEAEGPSFHNAVPFGDMGFSHGAYMQGDCDGYPAHSSRALMNPLSPHAAADRTAAGRKHQSLSIAIGRGHNDPAPQEPPTPGMFSPSFMDAVEGAAAAAAAAAAGVSSPFYNVASPYTPGGHSHHHSFSIPGAVPQGHGAADIFSPGSLTGTFRSDTADSGVSGPSVAGMTSNGTIDDFSAGLNITMNAVAAAAAAMGGPYDGSAHHRSSPNTSAFSRVPQGAEDMSHLLYGANHNAAQSQHQHSQHSQSGGLGIDINATTLAGLTNIPGFDQFPPASLSLGGSIDHGRFSSVGGPQPPLTISSPIVTAGVADTAGAPPHMVKSPMAAPRKSRKRAATVANIRSGCNPQQMSQGQRPPSSATLISGGRMASHSLSSSDAHTGPVFNSQAVVHGSGSKVMMVLTSKVAQKSYGTEKRFLCPPPTVLLFGDSWGLPTMASGDEAARSGDFAANMPRISVSVPTNDGADELGDGQSGSSETRTSQMEWLPAPEPSQKPKQHIPHTAVPPPRVPQEDETVTGRFVAKQLFINDVDEKRKKVAVKVRLHDPSGQITLNEFESRPIKVISKPSKKRQSVKNVDLCIHHGSTISLFNRLRSQTVSTKYLGATCSMSVGGPRPFWFPAGPTGDEPSSGTGSAAATTTFVARNSVWDPFIIWIVNTHLSQQEIEAFNARIAKNRTPIPGYPTPPTFALHPQCPPDFDAGGGGGAGDMDSDPAGQPQPRAPIPILYNQPVILQCVSTGMCSPVLTLRKVEKGSIATGSFYGRDSTRDVLGDPVSQLHKVAFEVRVQTRDELPAVTVTPAGLNTSVGSYLSCMGDIVGIRSTSDGRQLSCDSGAGSGSNGSGSGKSVGARVSPGHSRRQSKDGASVGTTSWAEDVGDSAVWTMVGTDCAIYRFDYPPSEDIVAQIHEVGATAAAATHNAAFGSSGTPVSSGLTGSLALPPTPTSPHGVRDYLQDPRQQLNLDMIFAGDRQDSTGTVGLGIDGGFHANSMDASFAAAAVCGMGISAGMGTNQSGAPLSADGERAVPVVFESSVQHPPTINPSALEGGRRHSDGSLLVPERSYISLQGLNFTPDMVVRFGERQSMFTEFKSPESIVCLGPLASEFAVEDKQHQQTIPTSPSASDSSTNPQGSDDAAGVLGPHHHHHHTHRASSAESTASSATATHSHTASLPGTGKRSAGDRIKVPIYLSCNGGSGPTFKTGQLYTVHL